MPQRGYKTTRNADNRTKNASRTDDYHNHVETIIRIKPIIRFRLYQTKLSGSGQIFMFRPIIKFRPSNQATTSHQCSPYAIQK
jgi:hypothetical protein